jgi:hypothetical protein
VAGSNSKLHERNAYVLRFFEAMEPHARFEFACQAYLDHIEKRSCWLKEEGSTFLGVNRERFWLSGAADGCCPWRSWLVPRR